MNDDIALGAPGLADILVNLGLPTVARERVADIDRALSQGLNDETMDVEQCASLILDAANLIADVDPAVFDWSGWGEEDQADADAYFSRSESINSGCGNSDR